MTTGTEPTPEDPICFFCDGPGYVMVHPGDVIMTCPFCKGKGRCPPRESLNRTPL